MEAIQSAGFELPPNLLFDEDFCSYNNESEFIDRLLCKELEREEPEPTIAMSVKKRPRTSTINTKPIVDDLDNDIVDDASSDNDNNDDVDENFSLIKVPSPPKIKRKRGRPRKYPKEDSTDVLQVLL